MHRKRHSRSNQALKNTLRTAESERQHQEIQKLLDKQFKQKQLFQESFTKIHGIKAILTQQSNGQLIEELNDVIDLIRGERVKAKMTIQDLHKVLSSRQDQFKVYEVGVNTDQLLECEFKETMDQANQTASEQKKAALRNEDRKFETYFKIVNMIDKLKVDYRLILPHLDNVPSKFMLPDVENHKGQYKNLKPEEILKLQNVFIGKLSSMLGIQKRCINQIKLNIGQSEKEKTPEKWEQKGSGQATVPNTGQKQYGKLVANH